MTSNGNCCGGTTTTCDSTIAELPRYYPRQLITPDDLTLEQNYFRDRLRRHNRLLHGWGVVCGAMVCPSITTNADGTTSFTPWQVQVKPGYVLGPYGDEIILDCLRTVDLRTSGCSGVTGQPCIDAPDPWCTQVFTPPSTTNILYIAVKYKQCMMRPVRVQPAGCGCDDTSCEYSRWHDGYEIGVLQTCPACNGCDPTVTALTANSLFTGDVPSCPDCSCGPWVCLAQVTLNTDGSIAQIDNCSCRRLVVSFCTAWWQCTDTLTVSGVTSAAAVAAGTSVQIPADGSQKTITVTGKNLEADSNAVYSFGPGITVTVQPPTSGPTTGLTTVQLTVSAATGTAQTAYNLTVRNADCSTYVLTSAITVVAPATPPATAAASTAPRSKAASKTPANAGSIKGSKT
jgi:hypothetical protein